MSGKMPRFLMTSIASLLLAACGVDNTEAIANQTEERTLTTEIIAKEVEITTNELPVKNRERALSQLLLETHLEKDEYDFSFVETDSFEYVEIEAREIQEDSEHASLEGVYRYIIETEEILMRDYLTGDYILYRIIE